MALRRVSLETSGVYRCEVTSKNSPGFDSQFEEGKMVVLGEFIMIKFQVTYIFGSVVRIAF